MERQEKIDAVIRLLKQGGGRFTTAELEEAVGGDRITTQLRKRRARQALFFARQDGLKLKAERHDKNNPQVVTNYVEVN